MASSNRLAILASGFSVTADTTNGPRIFTQGDNFTWVEVANGGSATGGPMVVSDKVPTVTPLTTTSVAAVVAHTASGDDPWPVPPPPPPQHAMTFPTLAKFLNTTTWTGDGLKVAGPGGGGKILGDKRR